MPHLIALVRLLVGISSRLTVLSVLAGVVGAVANAGLVAVICIAVGTGGTLDDEQLALFAGLCVVVLAAKIGSQALLIHLSHQGTYRLIGELCRRVVATSLRGIEELGASRVLTVLCEDISQIGWALIGLPIVAINAALLVCCLGYLLWVSPITFLVALGFMTIGIASYQILAVAAMRRFDAAHREQERLVGHFRAMLGGFKELKLNATRREHFLTVVLEQTTRAFRDQSRRAMTLFTSAGSWGQLLILVFIGMLLVRWPAVLPSDPATRTSAILVTLFLMSPLEAVLGSLPPLGQAGASLVRLESLGLALHPVAGEPARRPGEGALIELRAARYRYGDADDERGFAVGPIDLQLRTGELVFLVGGNGSGKTTLGKLVTGLYAPSAGEVLLDGQRVTEADQDWYRQHISAEFVDCHLFDDLIDVASDDRLRLAEEYLERLHLSHKVAIADGKLSTLELSQGQRKRLALLSAYLEDRPVYVFDEWAADQDPTFKDVFYLQLLPELKARGKAVLVITHDERYFAAADRVVRLENGQVEASDIGFASAASALGRPG